MNIYSKTDTGLVRSTNQDSFAAGELSNNACWAVVCDGMGGANGGNIASANGVKIISDYISSSYQPNLGSNSIKTILQSAICGANIRLYDMAKSIDSLKGMGTTVVVTVLLNDIAHIAHAGDSRAYLFSDGMLNKITKDHSLVQSMLDKGEITEDEAKVHPNRNMITRALGVENTIDFEYNEIDLKNDDILLICTDGLYNYVSNEKIIEVIKNNELSSVPQILVQLANDGGGGDNITVVVISK